MKPIENIEKDPHIQMFLQTRNMKPRTIELRLLQIKDYCKHHNMTPTQIIEEAEEDEDQQIKMKHRKIRKRLITYINHKINNEESPATILSRITSITLLYKTFEIQIPQLPRPHHDKEDYNIQNIVKIRLF